MPTITQILHYYDTVDVGYIRSYRMSPLNQVHFEDKTLSFFERSDVELVACYTRKLLSHQLYSFKSQGNTNHSSPWGMRTLMLQDISVSKYVSLR